MIPTASRPFPCIADFLQEALRLRQWFWSVFPIGANKKPIAGWRRFQDRPPTDRQLGRLFDRASVGGLAVVCGLASGRNNRPLCVRDFDELRAYAEWRDRYPSLAVILPTVLTPRPGAHVYCYLDGPEVFADLPDGELRASSRQYVVLPPSRHPSGRLYEWLTAPWSPADIPVLTLADTGFVPTGWLPPCRRRRASSHRPCTDPRIRANPRCDPLKPHNALCPPPGGLLRVDALPPEVRECVKRSLPVRRGERNSKLLALARSLKDVVHFDIPDALLVDVALAWWLAALPVIGTKDPGATVGDFIRAWDLAEVTMSQSVPRLAMRMAADKCAGPAKDKILAGARALAALSPNGTFFLSVRTAQEAARCGKSTAERALKSLEGDDTLKVVLRGVPSTWLRKATVYRLGSAGWEL
jgi:hypothetical protein